MADNFNMRKIHTGYVVEFRNGRRALAMRYDNDNSGPNMAFISPLTGARYGRERDWDSDTLNRLSSPTDFTPRRDLDIVTVYGYAKAGSPPAYAISLSEAGCTHRRVIWERKEAVKMTLAQVCEKLGYDVEIVKEEADHED